MGRFKAFEQGGHWTGCQVIPYRARIYLLTLPNCKQYVGMTTSSIKGRLKEHFAQAGSDSRPISVELRKLGGDIYSVWHEAIVCCVNVEDARAMESRYIAELNTLVPHGLNIQP